MSSWPILSARHLPAAGGRAVLPGRQRPEGGRRPQLPQRRAAHLAGDLPDLAAAVGALRRHQGGLPVRGEARLGAGAQHRLPHGHRRHLAVLRPAVDPADADLHPGELGSRPCPRQGVHDRVPRARDLHGRHVLRARSRAVLRLLRGRADPDVPDHRRVGRPAARLCRLQVLPLHAARLGADAAGDHRHLLAARHHRPADGHGEAATCRSLAVLAVARLLRLVRGQGADVAGPYLAARRPRRGADRGLGDPGRRAAEDGRLRLPAASRSRSCPRRRSTSRR